MIEIPKAFIELLKQSVIEIDIEAFKDSLQKKPITSIRINDSKLANYNIPKENILWCKNGYYLPERPQFIFDPLLHAGTYYVQEASSMLLEQAFTKVKIDQKELRILDACAAPGGKTTHLLSLMNENDILVSNEVIKSRVQILVENVLKWGYSNVIVTSSEIEVFSNLSETFDFVLADVPCSGEGMFRKDPSAIAEWSLNNVKLCSERQKKIISNLWGSIKPGGYLLYSTCTFNETENEDVINYIIEKYDAQCIPLNETEIWGTKKNIKNNAVVYKCFPHLVKGEGFSFSLIKKGDDIDNNDKTRKKEIKKKIDFLLDKKNQLNYNHLINGNNFICYQKNTEIWGIKANFKDFFEKIDSYLNIYSAGVPLIEIIGNKINPLPGYAFSLHLNRNYLPEREVDLRTALKLLKKETLNLEDCPKGWILITYKNKPIGFVKNIGNRANNPYPSNWKIISELPKDIQLPFLLQ